MARDDKKQRLMAWYPHAVKRPMPYNGQMPARRQVAALCIHTNGGGTDNGSLYSWFSRPGNNIASHFQVMRSGKVEQYIDTAHQAYAEVAGNDHCVSIETQDDGHPTTPWTTQQVASILSICRWLGVPAKVASATGDGISWHSLYGDFNPNHHDCPGAVRVAQIKKTLIPQLKGADDVTPEQLEAALIKVLTTAKIVTIPGEANPDHAGDKTTVVNAILQSWGHTLRGENK